SARPRRARQLTVRRSAALVRHITRVDPENNGYKYLYLYTRHRMTVSNLRNILKKLKVDNSRILDVHFPDRQVAALLVHNEYAPVFEEQMAQKGVSLNKDFDPLDPAIIRDPAMQDATLEERQEKAGVVHKSHLLAALNFIRDPVKISVARSFRRQNWITDEDLTAVLETSTVNTLTNTFPSSTLIFITETWLLSPTRYLTSWTQHHTYATPVTNTTRGRNGIALLIHPECRYPVNILPSTSPYLLSCQIADLLIHCTYLPPSLTNTEVETFLADLPLLTHSSQFNTLICGDFNARHTQLLGDRRTNASGRILRRWITEERLTCWNQQLAFGKPTFVAHRIHRQAEETSILDLFLSTCPLQDARMNISYDVDLTSDHKPVHLSFSLTLPPPPPASDILVSSGALAS
ncbi:Endonuclease/exonuclease/phosphatase, partial [Syncephalastrum racemosum]